MGQEYFKSKMKRKRKKDNGKSGEIYKPISKEGKQELLSVLGKSLVDYCMAVYEHC